MENIKCMFCECSLSFFQEEESKGIPPMPSHAAALQLMAAGQKEKVSIAKR